MRNKRTAIADDANNIFNLEEEEEDDSRCCFLNFDNNDDDKLCGLCFDPPQKELNDSLIIIPQFFTLPTVNNTDTSSPLFKIYLSFILVTLFTSYVSFVHKFLLSCL